MFLISIRVNFCDCVMWIISFHGITLDYFVASVKVFIDQPDVPLSFGSYATSSGNSTLH